MSHGSDNVDTLAEQAGYWDTRLRSPICTDEDRANFAAWRDSKPENRHAFEKIQTIVKTLRENSSRADIRALRDAARAARASTQASGLRPKYFRIAAAAAMLAFGAITWLALPNQIRSDSVRSLTAAAIRISEYATAQTYETGTGQRSVVTLQDGSTVDLNAKTRIRVAFNAEHRKVELLTGQALFHVAKNRERPFIVRAADRDITAIGTAFDVRLDATTVRVTLIEGRISVTQPNEPRAQRAQDTQHLGLSTQALSIPGQQLIAQLDAPPAPIVTLRTTDTAKVSGWREGRIFLEDLALADAIAEMNKYSQIQIRIEDSSLTQLRVNGMFHAGQQQAFINALEQYFPIAAHNVSNSEIVLTLRP